MAKAFFVLVPLSFLGGGVFISSMMKYFSYPDVFNFSYLTVLCLVLPFICLPLSALVLILTFKDKLVETTALRKTFIFIYWVIAVVFIMMFSFRFYYLNQLDERGYVTCPGIPSGWMPGMATKYAKTAALCSSRK